MSGGLVKADGSSNAPYFSVLSRITTKITFAQDLSELNKIIRPKAQVSQHGLFFKILIV